MKKSLAAIAAFAFSLGEMLSDALLGYLVRLGAVMYAVDPRQGKTNTATFRGRGNVERHCFILNSALTVNADNPYNKEFRLGHGWHVMWIHVAVTVVIGTGTTPLSDGLLRLIKRVFLKTDRGELVCNLPGRALWYMAAYRMGTRPQITTLAASNGTYHVYIPIFFSDPTMLRPEDTVLDTSRYQGIDFGLQLGTVSDLFGTPGTATYTATLDVEVVRTYGALPPEAKPHYFISYDSRPSQDASVNPNIELEKSADLAYKRLFVWTGDTGTAGIPWSGNANDTYAVRAFIQDQERFIEKDRVHATVQALNKNDSGVETVMAGVEVYDFVRDGAITAAVASGDKSALQYALTQAGAAAASIFTLSSEGIRLLKQ